MVRGVGACVSMALAVTAVGCARPQPPEGGPIPEQPLQVISTFPENLSVVEAFDDPVVIRFPRTLSERTNQGSLATAVLVSPETSLPEVRHRGDRLEVSLADGFEPGVVYRVTVLPRFQDRFQNRLEEPFDLFFSTGGPLEPNLLAGFVSDRLTLGPEIGARVNAVGADSVVYQAEADSTGIFSFPYLPSGAYTLVAFRDRNRSGDLDPAEATDELAATLATGDTVVTVDDLILLDPDTTAAQLQNANPLDGGTIRLTMDDYLDPDVPLAGVTTTIVGVDGGAVPIAQTLHEYQWEAAQPQAQAPGLPGQAPGQQPGQPADPTAAGQQQGGVPGAPQTPGQAVPGQASGQAPGGQQPGPTQTTTAAQNPIPPAEGPLPSRSFVVILGGSLVGGVDYDVTVEGVTNINGVPDGGGTVQVTGPDPFAGQTPPAQAPGQVPPDAGGQVPADAPPDAGGQDPPQ